GLVRLDDALGRDLMREQEVGEESPGAAGRGLIVVALAGRAHVEELPAVRHREGLGEPTEIVVGARHLEAVARDLVAIALSELLRGVDQLGPGRRRLRGIESRLLEVVDVDVDERRRILERYGVDLAVGRGVAARRRPEIVEE